MEIFWNHFESCLAPNVEVFSCSIIGMVLHGHGHDLALDSLDPEISSYHITLHIKLICYVYIYVCIDIVLLQIVI